MSSPGDTTYLVDPAIGDDANPVGKPWKTFGKLNSIKLAPGDKVVIAPGLQEETLKPTGGGTAEKPVVIQFLPGIHTIGIRNVARVRMFVSNSMDSDAPKPVGILIEGFKHLRLQGGGVDGDGKTTILYDGRMVQICNDHAEDITFTGLVFDLKRPTVSEFRVLETGPAHAVIQVAEGSDYAVEGGTFHWRGDWGPGAFCQTLNLKEGRCYRARTPRGWDAQGQLDASARDLGDRKIRLDYSNGESGLKSGHQYHFRNTKRDSVGVHTARCKDIVFRDCDFYALTGMGFVSQFTENITFQRVNVAPPRDTIRTCPAWADIFQFSNCKGQILVDSCRLSGMQDDAINCHGTYLRIIEKIGDNRLLVRFMHPQTYGFAAFVPGDEAAVICHTKIREYAGNPRRKVTAVERKSDKDWILTLDGEVPQFGENDVVDNITWHPDITVRNNHISVDPVRGMLLTTPGKAVVENNIFFRCAIAALSMSADSSKWFESSPVRDVLIRGNTFIGCGVCVDPAVDSASPQEPIHENIRIIDNDFDGAGVNAMGARNLTITGNRSAGGPLPIKIESSCTEVKVENNEHKFLHNGKQKDRAGWTVRDDVFITVGDWPHDATTGGKHGGLAPNYGGFRSVGFGPELGIGHALGDFYEEPVLLVKVAFGGCSLAVDMRPPGSGGKLGGKYSLIVKAVTESIERLPEIIPGYQKQTGYEITGFFWNQGESYWLMGEAMGREMVKLLGQGK